MSGGSAGEMIAAAAMDLVGARFQLQGRDPRTGLDCVGVILAALAVNGRAPPPVPPYTMRRTQLDPFDRLAAAQGLRDVSGAAEPGDVLVFRTGPAQWHAAIATAGDHVVHAHAALRRVVSSPVPPEWTIVRHWRVPS
ncbi:C40 family peptidase [Croceibacterium ferulae]|uniref:C40 family peptidase n=1 Tax=Croceibacterium ferulae TaxID=1854641 RepID=UPI001F4D4D98|nr:C40 family peptidase [Croceibacterium ferulae]